jgi:hypothetical protein
LYCTIPPPITVTGCPASVAHWPTVRSYNSRKSALSSPWRDPALGTKLMTRAMFLNPSAVDFTGSASPTASLCVP